MNAPAKIEPPSGNIYTALAAAQSEFGHVTKGAVNPAFKSKYANLADVASVVIPTLNRHGVAVLHYIVRGEEGPEMRTEFVHGGSETRVACDVPLIVDRQNMQGMKSATTYAKRIGLESLSGIAPEDDDGNAAAAAPPRQQQRPREVETDTPEGRAQYPFPSGPATGISQLKDMVRPVWRDLMSCGDLDELEGCISAHKAIIDQASRLTNPTHRAQLWEGDGKDNPGLRGVIEQQRAAFGKPTILQAG